LALLLLLLIAIFTGCVRLTKLLDDGRVMGKCKVNACFVAPVSHGSRRRVDPVFSYLIHKAFVAAITQRNQIVNRGNLLKKKRGREEKSDEDMRR
jgi:hypothetical protein